MDIEVWPLDLHLLQMVGQIQQQLHGGTDTKNRRCGRDIQPRHVQQGGARGGTAPALLGIAKPVPYRGRLGTQQGKQALLLAFDRRAGKDVQGMD